MEFVAVQPNVAASAHTKNQINRHIARTSHRRSRQARVEEYQKSRVEKAPDLAVHQDLTPTPAFVSGSAPRNQETSDLPLPRNLITKSIWTNESTAPFGHLLSSSMPREQFMLRYYASVVMPYINLHCPIMHSMGLEHYYYRSNWIFYASKEKDYYRGFLLSSCRHLSLVNKEQQYAELATEYKLQYLSEQRKNVAMAGPAAARSAITMALILGYDEIMLGDLHTAFKHIIGAAEIIKEAGGVKALGLSNFIRYVLYHCLQGNRLLSWDPLMHCSSSFMKPHLALPLIKDD